MITLDSNILLLSNQFNVLRQWPKNLFPQ